MILKTNKVGKTDVSVTSLSLGGSAFGNMGGEVSDAAVKDVIEYAWSAGIRYFDTAPHYGRGLSEQRMGGVLKHKPRDAFVLSSKVGRVLSPGVQVAEADGYINPLPNAVRYDYSADGIMESFETSCERIGTSRIDIVFAHDIGSYTHPDPQVAARHLDDLLGSGIGALRKLKQDGRIGAIGLGVNESQICIDVMQHEVLDVILLAGRLTLLDRQAEGGLLDACAKQGTSLVMAGIYNSGILATGPMPGAWFDYAPASQDILDRVAVLEQQAKAVGLTLAQAALQFALHHPAACTVMLGTGEADLLQRNLDTANMTLSDAAKAFVTT